MISHLKKVAQNWWNNRGASRLELDHLSLALLVSSQFEVLATFQWSLLAVFAVGTFHTEHDFLGGLGLETRTKISGKFQGKIHTIFLPSFWRWVWFVHRNLVVYDRNDDDPAMRVFPSTSCTVTLCGPCERCTCGSKCGEPLERWPGEKKRGENLVSFPILTLKLFRKSLKIDFSYFQAIFLKNFNLFLEISILSTLLHWNSGWIVHLPWCFLLISLKNETRPQKTREKERFKPRWHETTEETQINRFAKNM